MAGMNPRSSGGSTSSTFQPSGFGSQGNTRKYRFVAGQPGTFTMPARGGGAGKRPMTPMKANG